MEAVLSQKSIPAFIFDEMAGFNLKPIDKTKDEKEFPPASSNIINEKELVDNNTSLNGNQKSRAALIGKTWYTPQYEGVIYKFYEQIISVRKKGQEKRRKKAEELSEAEELEEADETDSLEDELDESEKKEKEEKEEEEKGLFEKIEDFLEQFEDEDGPLKRRRRKRKGVKGYLRDKLEEKWDEAKKRFKQKYIDPWTERAKNSLNEKIGKYKNKALTTFENIKKKFNWEKSKTKGIFSKLMETFKTAMKKIAKIFSTVMRWIRKFILKPLKLLREFKRLGLLRFLLKHGKKGIRNIIAILLKKIRNTAAKRILRKIVIKGGAIISKGFAKGLSFAAVGAKTGAAIGSLFGPGGAALGALVGTKTGIALGWAWTIYDVYELATDIYDTSQLEKNLRR